MGGGGGQPAAERRSRRCVSGLVAAAGAWTGLAARLGRRNKQADPPSRLRHRARAGQRSVDPPEPSLRAHIETRHGGTRRSIGGAGGCLHQLLERASQDRLAGAGAHKRAQAHATPPVEALGARDREARARATTPFGCVWGVCPAGGRRSAGFAQGRPKNKKSFESIIKCLRSHVGGFGRAPLRSFDHPPPDLNRISPIWVRLG